MYVTINGQEIYYQKVGKGKNLILLHGWGQDVSTFWPIVDLLRNNFTLWLIDLPGFGRSSLPVKSWFVKDYAKLVADFIQEQKVTRPIILGHSFGGRITIKLAASYPKLLDKIILVSSAGIKSKLTLKQLFVYLIAKIIKFMIPNFLNFKFKLRHQLYISIGSENERLGELKDIFLNISKEDLINDINKINTETLLICGENDDTVPIEDSKKIYHLIKNSGLEVLEGIGHFPHLENPNLLVHYVKDFC